MSTVMHTPDGESPPTGDPRALAERVLKDAPALIACLDTELRFRYANPTLARWFGVEPAQALGRRMQDVLDQQSYLSARAALLRALGGEPAHYEGELANSTSRHYVQGQFQPQRDAADRVGSVVAVFTDITRRHALELQLRESEQRFAQAFQHAAIGMALIHPDGQYLRVNAALCALLGYSETELLARGWRDLTHPADIPTSGILVEQLVNGSRDAWQAEKRYIHRDGHPVHVQLSVACVRNEAGRLHYMVAMVQDISERRRFEEMLQHECLLAEATLNSLGDAVVTTDPSLHVTSLNPIAEAMTGWNSGEARGRRMDEILDLRDPAAGTPVDNPLREALRRDTFVGLTGTRALWHRDGFRTPVEESAAPVHDPAGRVVGGVLVCHDASTDRALNLRLIHLGQHDALTGLPNRNRLVSQLEQTVQRTALQGSRCALLAIDIDNFRQLNETLGFEAGDHAMRTLAHVLRESLRDGETLYRVHSDEFALLVPQLATPADAALRAVDLLQRCARVVLPGAASPHLSASIGLGVFPDDGNDADMLQRHAGIALHEAMASGRGSWRRYDASMSARSASRHQIESALGEALARDTLSLYYQPMVDAGSGRIVGAEALLRWRAEGRDVFLPDQFIPVAEDSGLIVPLGAWALRHACAQARIWRLRQHRLPIAVNVSPLQLQHEGFYPQLDALLTEYGIAPGELELELTERSMLAGGDPTLRLLQRIRRRGVRLSLDDFGTGYCSLSYLRQLPADKLKIDRSFVRDLAADANTASITRAIIAMARDIDKAVIAEGVETATQADFLRSAHCGELQGYFYGRPMPATALEQQLAAC